MSFPAPKFYRAHEGDSLPNLAVEPIDSHAAATLVVAEHYLHRRPPISFAYGLLANDAIAGVVTFGTPASRHMQIGAYPEHPELAIELNRLWVSDDFPRNTESWFVSRALKMLPRLIILSYADTTKGHLGYVYRALNFNYAGWTDMDRKTPRYDYVPIDPTKHTREASRSGVAMKVRRLPKVKYWTVTGNHSERRALDRACRWPKLSWIDTPPPAFEVVA